MSSRFRRRHDELTTEFDEIVSKLRTIRLMEPSPTEARTQFEAGIVRIKEITAELDQLGRDECGPIWDDEEAFAKRYSPRGYSRFPPLRAIQVVLNWYLVPAVEIALIVVILVAALVLAWRVA